jgi:hypothetical protein
MILYKNLVPILAVQFSYTTQQQSIKATIIFKTTKKREVFMKSNVYTHTLVPWVRVTRVLPTFFTEKTEGALISYQSFFENGSAL